MRDKTKASQIDIMDLVSIVARMLLQKTMQTNLLLHTYTICFTCFVFFILRHLYTVLYTLFSPFYSV